MRRERGNLSSNRNEGLTLRVLLLLSLSPLSVLQLPGSLPDRAGQRTSRIYQRKEERQDQQDHEAVQR